MYLDLYSYYFVYIEILIVFDYLTLVSNIIIAIRLKTRSPLSRSRLLNYGVD